MKIRQITNWATALTNVFDAILNNKKYSFVFFCSLLMLLTIYLVKLHTPLYWGHDTAVHYARLDGLMTAMRDGRFPMYINYSGLQGYGYFIKAFYCDFLLIPFAFIGLLTDTMFAYEAILLTITFMCGILTYWAVNRIFDDRYAAMLSAILYTFCSYRLLDLYQRGALGEVVSFTFLPIVLVGAYELIKGDYKKWYILTIGYSLLIFNHVLSTILTTIVLLLFVLIYIKPLIREPKRIAYFALAAIATLVVVAYYIVPMFEQIASGTFYYQKYPSVSELAVFAVKPSETIIGLLNSITPSTQEFTIRIGALLTFGVAARVFIKRKTVCLPTIDLLCAVGLFLIFATTQLFPWSSFPFNKLYFIQFPWRFIEFVSFLLAIAGGYYLTLSVKSASQKMIILIGISLCSMAVIAGENKNFMYYALNEVKAGIPIKDLPYDKRVTYGNNEYVPAKVDPTWDYLEKRGYRVISQNKDTRVADYGRTKSITSFNIEVTKPDILELPMFYYKGYTASLNDKTIAVSESENGMVSIPANETGKIVVYYEGTTIQMISCWISLVASIGLATYIFVMSKKRA